MPLALNVVQKQFCVLQKKVLSFGPNRTVEVRPNSSAEPNVCSVTTEREVAEEIHDYGKYCNQAMAKAYP